MSYASTSPFSVNKPQKANSSIEAPDNSGPMAAGLAAAMTAIIAVSVFTQTSIPALATIPLFIFAVLIYAAKDTTTAIAIYLAYTALEGMFKYMTDFSQVVYVVKPLLAVAILLGWFAIRRREGGQPLRLPLGGLLALFVAWGAFEVFNPTGNGFVGGLVTLLVWYVIPLAFYLIGNNARFSARQIVQLLYVIIAVCTVVSAFAFVQFSMGRDWTIAHVVGYRHLSLAMWTGTDSAGQDTMSFRPASTTSAEGFATLWSNAGALSSLALLLLPGVPVGRKVVLIGCLMINISGLLVSGVRLFLMISIMEVALMFFLTSTSAHALRRNLIVSLLVGIVALVGFNAAQSVSNGAIASRYADTLAHPYEKYSAERQGGFAGQSVWLTSFLTDHPFGIGYQRGIGGKGGTENTDKDKISVNRETQFAAIGDDMGLPGLAFFSLLAVSMLAYGNTAFRRLKNPEIKILAITLFIALIGYTVGYWGGQMLAAVGDFIWLFAGLLYGLPLLERRTQAAAQAASQEKAGPIR